jgi:hypothetical protein
MISQSLHQFQQPIFCYQLFVFSSSMVYHSVAQQSNSQGATVTISQSLYQDIPTTYLLFLPNCLLCLNPDYTPLEPLYL